MWPTTAVALCGKFSSKIRSRLICVQLGSIRCRGCSVGVLEMLHSGADRLGVIDGGLFWKCCTILMYVQFKHIEAWAFAVLKSRPHLTTNLGRAVEVFDIYMICHWRPRPLCSKSYRLVASQSDLVGGVNLMSSIPVWFVAPTTQVWVKRLST